MYNKGVPKNIISLNFLFLIYSLTGVFLKISSNYSYFSPPFLLYFSLAVVMVVIYAIGWQLALQKTHLNKAYLNKSVVILWGIIWGAIFFDERIDMRIIMGGVLILAGIILVIKE